MQDLIPFSIKIQNLVSFLETLQNSNIHLCNPTLCSEMVSKLPVSKQDQWLRYALSIRPYFTLTAHGLRGKHNILILSNSILIRQIIIEED